MKRLALFLLINSLAAAEHAPGIGISLAGPVPFNEDAACTGVTLSDNSVSENEYGVVVACGATDNTIIDNTIVDNTACQAIIDPCQNTVKDNIIDGPNAGCGDL